MSSLDSWLYGGDPAQNLCQAAVFQSLRAKVGEGYFERFLQESLLDNPHHARLCMLPSHTLGQENREKEQARLQALRAGWDASTAASVMDRFQQLRAHQEAPDTPEQLACLPVLSLSDIPETVRDIPQVIKTVEGTPLLHQNVDTGGIVYLDLYFSLADIPQEKLSQVSFLSKLLGQTATEHYGVIELRSEIESNLGRFSAAPMVFSPHGQPSQASPYLAVSVSLLEGKKADAVRLIGEVLNASLFHDQQYIYHLLHQSRMNLEQSVVLAGNSFAAHRALAGFSAAGAVSEAFQGIDFLRWMQKTDRSFEARAEALCSELARLSQMLFTRERLTVSVTGPCDTVWVSQVIRTLPSAQMGEAAEYSSAPVRREGFLIPAEVGFAAKAGSLGAVSARYTGQARVAAQLLTYGYLWNTIRVKGGAYGTSLNVQADGGVSLTSYRDPSAAQSLRSFDGAGAALREVCDSGEMLDKYIISTIAAVEPLLTPRQEGLYAAIYHFTGRTREDRQRLRREILHTTREDLAAFSRTLDALCSRSGICVIGGKRILDECSGALDSVEPLQ